MEVATFPRPGIILKEWQSQDHRRGPSSLYDEVERSIAESESGS